MHLSQHWTVKLRICELILAFEMGLTVNNGTVGLVCCVLVLVAFQGIVLIPSERLLEKMLLVTKCAIP